jgi:diguanylate cyclase (GGDEF)-like protein
VSALLCPVRNALLYQKAIAASLTDPLTGAGNRQALFSHLGREVSLSRRYQQPMSVLMIDIDKFKSINDTYGHATGDLVLQDLIEVMTKVNRNTDLCFRYGGEEFVVILSNTDTKGALKVAQTIQEAIANLEIIHENSDVSNFVTLSMGVASLIPTLALSPEVLISHADQSLYVAKQKGRNQAIGYPNLN